MKTEEIIIANLKCIGCATTIKNELLKVKGIKNAEIDIENDVVTVSYNENEANRVSVIEKLYNLGYPEATENNGLLLQLKSYTSCMIGKITNITTKQKG